MVSKHTSITLCIVIALLFGIAACGRTAPRQEGAAVTVQAEATAATPAAAVETEATLPPEAASETVTTETVTTESVITETASTETAVVTNPVTSEVQSGEVGDVVSETMTTEEAAPGQSAPGAAAGEAPDGGEPPLAGERVAYTNDDYGFRVEHPAGYIVSAVSPEKLAPLDPKPVDAIAIMNPTLAAGDIAELELPDLEIRVHPAEGTTSLQDWLTARGFSNEGYLPAQPFQAAAISGLEVCASTMVVPGCSYFVLGDGWVYQMVPASQEGEAILYSFALLAS